MGVGIASKQHGLEEEHANGPDCWTTAEPGQDVARYDRLDLKQQERTEKDGDSKTQHVANPLGEGPAPRCASPAVAQGVRIINRVLQVSGRPESNRGT